VRVFERRHQDFLEFPDGAGRVNGDSLWRALVVVVTKPLVA